MKLSVNAMFQGLAVLAQALNAMTDMVPEDQRPAVLAVLSILQGTVALWAHVRNPDGTKAAEPYIKKSRT